MFHVEQAQEKHIGYPHKTTNIKKPLPKEWLFNINISLFYNTTVHQSYLSIQFFPTSSP